MVDVNNNKMANLREKNFFTPPQPLEFPNPYRLATTNALLTALLRQQAGPSAVPTTSTNTATVAAGVSPLEGETPTPGETRAASEARKASKVTQAVGEESQGESQAMKDIEKTRRTSARLAKEAAKIKGDYGRVKKALDKADLSKSLKAAGKAIANQKALADLNKSGKSKMHLTRRYNANQATLKAEKSAHITGKNPTPSVKKAFDEAQKNHDEIAAGFKELKAVEDRLAKSTKEEATLNKAIAARNKLNKEKRDAKTQAMTEFVEGNKQRTTALQEKMQPKTQHEKAHDKHKADIVKHARDESDAMKKWRLQFGKAGGLKTGGGGLRSDKAQESKKAVEKHTADVYVAASKRSDAEKALSKQVQMDQNAVKRAKWVSSSDAAALQTLSDKLTKQLAAYNQAEENAENRGTNEVPANPRNSGLLQAHTEYMTGRAKDWKAYEATVAAFNTKMRAVYSTNNKTLPKRAPAASGTGARRRDGAFLRGGADDDTSGGGGGGGGGV